MRPSARLLPGMESFGESPVSRRCTIVSRTISLSARVPEELAGSRLDRAAAELFADYSRARLQGWIRDGRLRVEGRRMRPRDTVKADDRLSLEATLDTDDTAGWHAEAQSLSIVHEDDHLLVIDKPAGLVVHPAAGNRSGTLVNGLLHYSADFHHLPRAGIVHRLDKDTSGLLVVARSLKAHQSLVQQLHQRTVGREYEAIVSGVMTAGGTVDQPIGRHPVQRKKQAVVSSGRPAVTHYRVLARYRGHTRVAATLETGRTHQIRVHMHHIHHPLVGDGVYGRRLQLPRGADQDLIEQLRGFRRQALHARRLELTHPQTGQRMHWVAEPPGDMQRLQAALEADAARMGEADHV